MYLVIGVGMGFFWYRCFLGLLAAGVVHSVRGSDGSRIPRLIVHEHVHDVVIHAEAQAARCRCCLSILCTVM